MITRAGTGGFLDWFVFELLVIGRCSIFSPSKTQAETGGFLGWFLELLPELLKLK